MQYNLTYGQYTLVTLLYAMESLQIFNLMNVFQKTRAECACSKVFFLGGKSLRYLQMKQSQLNNKRSQCISTNNFLSNYSKPTKQCKDYMYLYNRTP